LKESKEKNPNPRNDPEFQRLQIFEAHVAIREAANKLIGKSRKVKEELKKKKDYNSLEVALQDEES